MSINNPNPLAKRTTPQLALIHAAESVGVSAGLTVVAAIYQFWLTHGLNFAGLAQVAGLSFIGALGLIYKTVKSNPNLGPAFADTVGQFKEEAQLILDSHFKRVEQLVQQITGSPLQVSQPIQNAPQATQGSPWNSQVPPPQLQFPAISTFTAPQAAISSSQAQQAKP